MNIPQEWTVKPLADVVEIQRGFDLPHHARKPGPYPVLTAGETGGFHDEGPIKGPGVTIGRATNLGRPKWSNVDFWPHNTTMFVKDFKGNNPRWVYHLFEATDLSGFDSGSVQPMLNRNYIAQVPVRVPPVLEQQAIADVLGALDDKIAANNKVARTIEALGSAKFMRVGMDVEPSREVILLGEVFDLNPRRTVTSSSPTVIDMQALPTAEPLVERWSTGIRKGGTRFANGDTLIARITPCLENRKTAFVDFLEDGDVGIGSTEFIVMRSKNDLPLGLSYFMAISDRFRDFAIQNLVGTSGRQRVSASDLARHTLCPVDLAILQSFGQWADTNLKVLGSLRGENRILITMYDALLPQLMSGKLRIREAEEAVTAVI